MQPERDSTAALAATHDDTGQLERMFAGFAMTHSIYAAAKLGIADLLEPAGVVVYGC